MKVIKRDGRLEQFNLGKVKTSLIYASDTAEMELNESDIKMILYDIENLLKNIRGKEGKISSIEIIGAIVSVLRENEFNKLLKTFVTYKK